MKQPACISCKRPSLYTWNGFCQTCYPPKRPHHDPQTCRHVQCTNGPVDKSGSPVDKRLCEKHSRLTCEVAA